jgi:hypothetical protein
VIGALSPADRYEYLRLAEERAARRARVSLGAFLEYVFEAEPAPHQRPILEALEAVERGELRRLLVIAPPGHAKSTIGSIVFPAWYIGRHSAETIVGVTTTDTLGDLYADAIAGVIEFQETYRSVYPAIFPDRKRGWSRDGRFVREAGVRRSPRSKDPSFLFVGAGGGVIGRRASGVVIDDPVDEAVARSELLLERRVTWVQRSVLSRLQPGAWAVCLGTLWTQGDVVDTLRASGEWTVIHMRALSDSRHVRATVAIPDGVAWRPSRSEPMTKEPDWW